MKAKITSRFVKSLAPQPKPFEVTDTDLPGFRLRVQPSGNMNFYADYRLPDGRRNRKKLGSASVLTVAQARDTAKEVLADVVKGEDPRKARKEARSHTLGSYLDEVYGPWLLANRKAGANTLARLKSSFAGLLSKKLTAITDWDVGKWRAQRIRESGSKTAGNRDIACLKAALSVAVRGTKDGIVRGGLLDTNPVAGVELAKRDRDDPDVMRTLTPEEETRLWEALAAREERIRRDRDKANLWRRSRGYKELPNLREVEFVDHLRPMLTLLLHTGLRRGEAFSLEWRDLDLEGAELTVRGATAKSGRTRRVPLNQTAVDTLTAWRSQSSGSGLVFPSPQTGERLDNIRTAWRNVLKEAGIKGLTLHMLRHTFASRILTSGADIETVRALLGHVSITTTAIYLHADKAVSRAAVERLVNVAANVVQFPAAEVGRKGE